MQIISNDTKAYLMAGGYVAVTINIEGTDGNLTITSEDIIENSLTIDRNSVSGSNIEIGNAETSELVFELENDDQAFDDFKFEGATASVILNIDGAPLNAGVFVIDSPPKKETILRIRALDNMCRFNMLYDTDLTYPATLLQIVQDACLKCSVTFYNTSFTNSSYVVAEKPNVDGLTYHEIIAFAAELAGCNAWCDWLGQLRFSWYGETQTEQLTVGPDMRYAYSIAENNITITGLTFRTADTDYQLGTDNYSLVIENNALMPGEPNTAVLTAIFNKINGFTYRPFDFDIDGLPYVWPGDLINKLITYTGEEINSIITNHKYELNGLSRIAAKGQTAEQVGQIGPVPFTDRQKTILQSVAKQETTKQVSALEQDVLTLNSLVNNSLGYYETVVTDPDTGAKKYYTHDSPTLEGSQVIYTKTSLGFAWTTTGWNGGSPAWQYGLTSTGNAVLKVLSAYGINAEWIITGILQSVDGKTWINLDDGTFSFANGALKYTDGQLRIGSYDTAISDIESDIAGLETTVDNIEVGARNLIIRSTETANLVINNSGGLSARTDHAVTDYIKITPSTNYVASKITSVLSSDNHFRIGWYDIDKAFIERIYSTDNTFFMTSPATAEYMRISYPTDSRPKLEKGNKPTDWTPAPEDVDQSIATVQENVDTLADSLGDLAYLDLVEKAKLGTTVIDGGYLVTDLIEAKAITGAKLADGTVSNIKIASGLDATKITVGTLDAARVSIGAGTTFASGYDPSTKETPAGAQAKVDAIQIGARNLAWSTKEDWGDWITPPANASSGRYIVGFAYLPEDKAVGDEYTCAVEIEFKDVGAGSGGAFRFYADGRVDYQDNVTNIWNTNLISLTTPPADGIQRRVYTAQITADNVNGEQFDLGFCSYYWNGTGKYRVRRIKVEKGNRDTDWSPAPEDVDANITGSAAATKNNVATNLGYTDYADMVAKATQGKTIIDGGYINTDLIEANSITASKIAAGTITATEIASDSITSDKLNVLAKSLVNNYSRTGVLTGWETTDGSIVVDTDLNAPVHRVTTTTNRTIRSDYFEVDPTKTYKVTLSIKCEDTDGTRYFGLWAYDKNQNAVPVTRFNANAGTFGNPTTNFYFRSYAGPTNGWLHIEGYILGCNVTDKSEIPIGKNANYHCRMPANCSQIRLRYLNYGTAGTTRTAYFFSPTVTPVDSGTIRAENIVAGTIDAGLVNIVTGTGTSKVEITGTGIDGYLNNILRVQLEYDRLEFHRAGNVVGNVRSEYINESWHGSPIGDALFIEAAGNAIAFNAVSGSTAPSFVVWPTWAEAPLFESGVITVGVTDPKKWTIKTNSTDTEFSIEHYLGTKLALSSDGAIKVNDVSLATEPIHFYHYTNGVLIDLGVAPTSNNLYTLKIFGNSYKGYMPVDTILQFHWRASSSLIESCKQINNALGIDAAKVFTDGGNIKVWFPQPATYTRFYIDCYDSSGKLQPVSVTNASEPTGTGKVTATSFSSWTSQNFNPANYLPLSGGTMTGQLNMGSNNIVGSTSKCWITARRIGLGVAANSTYTMDAGTTGNIRCNQVYATKYHAGAGEGQSAMVKVLDSLPSSGPVHRVLEFVNGILVGFHTV